MTYKKPGIKEALVGTPEWLSFPAPFYKLLISDLGCSHKSESTPRLCTVCNLSSHSPQLIARRARSFYASGPRRQKMEGATP